MPLGDESSSGIGLCTTGEPYIKRFKNGFSDGRHTDHKC
jgi:hypothetical protein